MISVVIDVDDTLIDTRKRTQGIWKRVLGRQIPMRAVETLSPPQIFEEFASTDQRSRMGEMRKQFQDILLCKNDIGIDLIYLDEPIPHAAGILQEWSEQCNLVYLTGRLETIRELTLDELRRFGLPTKNTELTMFNPEDWGKAPLVNARERLFSSVYDQHDVIRVIDDYPGYFSTYRQFDVPERIGLHRSKLFSSQDYIDRGATRVIESWRQLQDDPPQPRSGTSI